MVMMPIVGRIYNRVSPRVTVAVGVILFVISAYMMGHYNLNTTSGDVVVVLVLQGVAFACLFIPLTTVALANIPRHKLADATGLNSLLRQIGGSLGLAVFASLIPRFTKQATVALSTHLDAGRPELLERLAQIGALLQARGYDAASAALAAPRVLAGAVARQAMVITFDKLFFLSGLLFLLVLPLLFFLKSPNHREQAAVETHVEI
jgi:DHA2 family multidrug resistance protein